MNYREMLELAAKAAGFQLSNRLTDGGLMVRNGKRRAPKKWNPLADDGDALRLAVKLKFHVDINDGNVTIFAHSECGCKMTEEKGDDCSATRRAIVRAAASIGKEMEG